MEWLAAISVLLVAMGFMAWKQGGWYAFGIAIFLILVATAYALTRRYFGGQGALAFSLAALAIAFAANWFFRRKPKN